GVYCWMCAGGNRSRKSPTWIGAYLKRLSGWAGSVTALTHDARVTLDADSNDFGMYARSGREYFLIENRRQLGRDAALPDEGLAIWHIDEDGDNSNEQMTADKHYECSLEQADGQFQLARLQWQYRANAAPARRGATPLRSKRRPGKKGGHRPRAAHPNKPSPAARPRRDLPQPAGRRRGTPEGLAPRIAGRS